ncbi:MAG: LamB/YcsF family protein [Alphaproteobacteria bacterium]
MEVNINADLGESFGPWKMGMDEALLKIVQSANVACGFHASDPSHMRTTVELCQQNGVSIGAHPGFPDLQGFGRRKMDLSAQEIFDLVVYQIGALEAVCSSQNAQVTHCKAHGALSNMAMVNSEYASAIAKAVKAVNSELVLLAVAGTELSKAGKALGLKVAEEIFADRNYTDEGTLVDRRSPNAMVKGGEASLEHVKRMINEQALVSVSGKRIPTSIHSICVHGDQPTAVEAASHVANGLKKDGITLKSIPELHQFSN